MNPGEHQGAHDCGFESELKDEERLRHRELQVERSSVENVRLRKA